LNLWAISDLHIGVQSNKNALRAFTERSDDWLILAGDICERAEDLEWAFSLFTQRFSKVFWVPGNHELWLVTKAEQEKNSLAKYASLVTLARKYGIVTPEDPWLTFPVTGHVIVPLFTMYDYSFRPAEISRAQVIEWAMAENCLCTDEVAIKPAPFKSVDDWSRQLCERAISRFDKELPEQARTILINHFPLREDLVHIPRVPRFSPWCGTKETEHWHIRYRADVVVSGHLHVRSTRTRDGTRFEEVSLGYARQWDVSKGLKHYLRKVI
jgi:predicted phosphodiesterase